MSSDQPRTYTPGEASDMLGIPSSTLRRYIKYFRAHLSEGARRSINRVFTQDDLGVLAAARELAEKGMKLDEIATRLGDISEPIELPQSALDYPGIQKRIESIFELFQEHQAEINKIRAQQQQEVQEMRDQHQQLMERIANLENELEREQQRSILDRILGRGKK